MAHGFAATKDSGLRPFAEHFARSGFDVLAFDYRGFGTSAGAPRQDVNHRRHRQDYHAAIAAARAQPGVDPAKIVLWGSSYSGGHVVAVAAQDPTICAVISQVPIMDGVATISAMRHNASISTMTTLTAAAIRDVARILTRRAPHLIPAVGQPGTTAVITAPGAEQGNQAVVGPTYCNEVCARVVLRTAFNRPVRAAKNLTCPTLFIIADHDDIAPPDPVHRAATHIGSNAEVHTLPCSHFDVYLGDAYRHTITAQTEFLRRIHTPPPPA